MRVASWYLRGISFAEVPSSLADLAKRFTPIYVESADLLHQPKWEPLLRGEAVEIRPGWTTLESLAQTRRGIATGSNNFFLISADIARAEEISPKHLRNCIGRANDVNFPVFRGADFTSLLHGGGKCLLVDFGRQLSDSEKRYVKKGEDAGLHVRRPLLGQDKFKRRAQLKHFSSVSAPAQSHSRRT